MWEKERYRIVSHAAFLSLTPTLLSPTHPDSESATVAALPEALAQWTGLELPPVLHDGWCVSVCVCMWVLVSVPVSLCLRVKLLLPLSTPASSVSLPSFVPSIHPCSSVSLPPLLFLCLLSRRVEAIVGLSGVGFCSPAAASSPHGPCKTRLLLPQGPQASAALPPNKFAVTLSAIGLWIGSK